MRRLVFVWAALVLGGFLFTNQVEGQIQLGSLLPNPRLTSVTPHGGKAGTTLEVSFAGTDLEDPQAMLFSHPGIKAEAIIPQPPPPPKVDPKKPPPKPLPPTPITKFKVTIGPDVPLGYHDVRFVNKWGISNPRVFVVGDLKEEMEKEPNNDVEQAQRIEIGTTINGVIAAPTDVDYSVFAGKKGQRVLISCLAGTIDSRLNPELRLFDANGRQIAYNRPSPGLDGLLDSTLPEDGEYYIRLCQFTYTLGNPEYFYRLNVSTGPWIDLIVPPMVEPGKETKVTIYGRNLPEGKPDPSATVDGVVLDKITATINAPKDPAALQRMGFTGHVSPLAGTLDGFEYRLKTPAGASNPYLLTFAHAPIAAEKEEHGTVETAQELNLPAEVAGSIRKRGDRHWYSFNAKKGDVYMIEVLSHRLGFATDMYFSLLKPASQDAKGQKIPQQEIVQQDDTTVPLSLKNFYTVNRDPQPYRFVVPADGKYEIMVASHLGDTLAGINHLYRLRISPENPDYRLVVLPPDDYRPDACTLGQGGNRNFIVLAERLDGFKGEIALTVDGLPKDVTSVPQTIGPNTKECLLVVSAAPNAPVFTGEIKIKGKATINGKEVVREARPASITWPVQPQQNIPTIARLDRNLMLAVRDKSPFNLVAKADQNVVTHGGKVNIKLTLNRLFPDANAPFQVLPSPGELPPGVTFANVTIPQGKGDANLILNVAANVQPGTYSFVFRGFAPVPFSKNSMDKKKANINVVMPSTPVNLTILPKSVANLTVPPNINAKLGTNAEVVVKAARLFDNNDPLKVQLILPPGTQGLAADEVTIPPGKDEAKLIIRVLPNTPPGNRANLTVRATAVIQPGNVTLNHEAKININVVK